MNYSSRKLLLLLDLPEMYRSAPLEESKIQGIIRPDPIDRMAKTITTGASFLIEANPTGKATSLSL